MRHWVGHLFSLVLGAVSFSAEAAPTEAHPSLWTPHGKLSTVYLFGSIHLLPPELSWRDAR